MAPKRVEDIAKKLALKSLLHLHNTVVAVITSSVTSVTDKSNTRVNEHVSWLRMYNPLNSISKQFFNFILISRDIRYI